MQFNKLTFLLPALIAFISLFVILKTSYGLNVSIEGNGAGSSNQVNVNQTDQLNVNQNNSANVSNNVDVNCNTGGNSASGNTGNCTSNVNISNNLNTNQTKITCPGCFASPTPKPIPSSGVPPTGGNGGAGGGNGGGGVGGAGQAAGPQGLGGAGVAGDTVMFLAGFGILALGLWQVRSA